MSSSLALALFWGSILAAALFTRCTFPAFTPDRNFTDTFKGVAMFLVLYHHSRIYNGSEFWHLFGGGDAFVGVSMFFFISGFGMVRSQENKEFGPFRFLWERFVSLAPGVALCMLARGALGPFWGRPFALETDPITLLGLREWFLAAIWIYYLIFALCWRAGRTTFERGICVLCFCLLIAAGLANIQSRSDMAHLWLRFPFSFAAGVLAASRMEPLLDFCRRRALAVLAVTGATLGLAFSGRVDSSVPATWLADLAVIPFGVAVCALLYRLRLTSGLWLFFGRTSLFLYLVQVPLLKYGWFTHVWRSDMVGLLTCWAAIALLAASLKWTRDRFMRSLARLAGT